MYLKIITVPDGQIATDIENKDLGRELGRGIIVPPTFLRQYGVEVKYPLINRDIIN